MLDYTDYVYLVSWYINFRLFLILFLRKEDYKTVKHRLILFVGDFVSNYITGIALTILFCSLFLYISDPIVNLVTTIAFDGTLYLALDLLNDKFFNNKNEENSKDSEVDKNGRQ